MGEGCGKEVGDILYNIYYFLKNTDLEKNMWNLWVKCSELEKQLMCYSLYFYHTTQQT